MARPNFALHTETEVLNVNRTPDAKRATGVTFVGNQGVEYEEPAEKWSNPLGPR